MYVCAAQAALCMCLACAGAHNPSTSAGTFLNTYRLSWRYCKGHGTQVCTSSGTPDQKHDQHHSSHRRSKYIIPITLSSCCASVLQCSLDPTTNLVQPTDPPAALWTSRQEFAGQQDRPETCQHVCVPLASAAAACCDSQCESRRAAGSNCTGMCLDSEKFSLKSQY